jgi:hypothetical protein
MIKLVENAIAIAITIAIAIAVNIKCRKKLVKKIKFSKSEIGQIFEIN